MPEASSYDVLIAGGGMVGASLAVALAPLDLKVAMIDAYQFGAPKQPSYDDRSIALSYGSSLIFSGMGLWHKLAPKTTPINEIHISDRGHFGATRLTAKQEKTPALGYLVESRVLGGQLYQALKKSCVELIAPASVSALNESANGLLISLERGGESLHLETKLLIGADGTQSKVRELSGIPVKQRDYRQSAIIANVSTEKPHQNRAFERFTDNGPIALLPLSDNRCSLVWTQDTKHGTASVENVMALSDADFLEKLNHEFGYRLGSFTQAGKRSCYPLSLFSATRNTAKRTVIIGNASHTLHPVAGQGLNLALRDIAVLADLIAEHAVDDVGGASLLNAYEAQRKGDMKTTIGYTDSLVRLFSNNNPLLGHARAAGLLAVDRIAPLRNWITHQSMGINYRQSRLARGLALRAAHG